MTITPEQAQLRQEWVEALESGEYLQCERRLYDGVGYCCLGVLEKVVGSNFVADTAPGCDCPTCDPSRTDYAPLYRIEGTGEGAVLSPETQERLGFVESDPMVWVAPAGVPSGVSLATLNDKHGFTLARIAAVIRAQPADWDGSYR
jgi:hypothetical protein